MKTLKNRTNEKKSQTAFDFTKKKISKSQRHKTVTFIATFEKF